MKEYFTISEFAKLRNININSLRYYEKIGCLKPAYIDPHTKYRFYSIEQLCTLDIILMSIDLGLPLKELEKYIDNNGIIENRKLIEKQKELIERHIKELYTKMKMIEKTLRIMDRNKQFEQRKGIYSRVIEERKVMVVPAPADLSNMDNIEKVTANLYAEIQQMGVYPILPAGLLIQYHHGTAKLYLFLEIMGNLQAEKEIVSLPKAEYLCMQIAFKPANDLSIINENFEIEEENTFVITNMMQDRLSFSTMCSEIQKLIV